MFFCLCLFVFGGKRAPFLSHLFLGAGGCFLVFGIQEANRRELALENESSGTGAFIRSIQSLLKPLRWQLHLYIDNV